MLDNSAAPNAGDGGGSDMSSFPYQRIVVIGVTSSGKSTLAETLAKRFDMDFIELDALHWEPGWQEAQPEVFRARVEEAIKAKKWVIAGNYREVRGITWSKADAVIWLDYPFSTVLWQLTRRTFKRCWTHELLWGTNYETLGKHFKLWSTDSLFHWLLKTYWRRKREYTLQLSQPENQHLKVIQLKNPRETVTWLDGFQ
jgi:adenylate kinase family enzyme